MPQIIVTADDGDARDRDAVTLKERINVADFESERFAANLVERLGWAVVDAAEVERSRPDGEDEPPRLRRKAAGREPVPA